MTMVRLIVGICWNLEAWQKKNTTYEIFRGPPFSLKKARRTWVALQYTECDVQCSTVCLLATHVKNGVCKHIICDVPPTPVYCRKTSNTISKLDMGSGYCHWCKSADGNVLHFSIPFASMAVRGRPCWKKIYMRCNFSLHNTVPTSIV